MGTPSRSPSSYTNTRRPVEGQQSYLIYPRSGIAQGPLLPPQNRVIMGNANAAPTFARSRANNSAHGEPVQRSNLTALLEGQQHEGPSDVAHEAAERAAGMAPMDDTVLEPIENEADSASGPSAMPRPRLTGIEVHSAPASCICSTLTPPSFLPSSRTHGIQYHGARRLSAGDMGSIRAVVQGRTVATEEVQEENSVRRCMSSKELGTLAPPTGSPYAYLLHQKEILNATMQQRLMDLRESTALSGSLSTSPVHSTGRNTPCSEVDSIHSHRERAPLANQTRNRRRAEHSKAVIADLCEIVTDLFVAESKLLNPSNYGVQGSVRREEVLHSVEEFVSALPPRYALGADTPSEVLVHMRLMAAVRSDPNRAVVHIANLEDGSKNRCRRLVTICCGDATGLLEYISKLLATGGSSVVDADVMMTTDGIVLDRFIVEMNQNGRLRLDKLANCIEAFMQKAKQKDQGESEQASPTEADKTSNSPPKSLAGNSPSAEPSGPLYVFPSNQRLETSPRELHDEIQSAVPLTEVLESHTSSAALGTAVPMRTRRSIPTLRRGQSMPSPPTQPILSSPSRRQSLEQPLVPTLSRKDGSSGSGDPSNASTLIQRRPLVNREATNFGDALMGETGADYIAVAPHMLDAPHDKMTPIPLIPFEELMLIETLGMGRVSTIYRAAWQRNPIPGDVNAQGGGVEMVALKVATVNPENGDSSHVDELRREADIAAMLHHTNVCELVGVAADAECFCLAYEFCEGGSLLSLLSDTTRYYEYLPIALDIANGMAYLHSRDVIHRDLKPSNVLLSRDHRAKIADFGMSVANTGQELTAETGTYRYMAPEVIRHESYSSNADVYSFGIVLWQLITREVPFATMTPIQAAFAVAEGRRPEIPASTPPRLQEIITSCWDQDSQKRPSFTYVAMALADYARMAFNAAAVGAQTLQIANEMLVNVSGNSTVNVDFTTGVGMGRSSSMEFRRSWLNHQTSGSYNSNVGLEI